MITSLAAARVGHSLVELRFASDLPDPTFYVYRDGALLAATAADVLLVAVDPGDAPVFEVFDDPGDVPSPALPGHVTLAWYAAPAADHYRVEQLDGADWAERDRVADDGRGYQTWASGRLADGLVHRFRVVPVGAAGNDGTPAAFATLLVRVPDAPAATFAYDPDAAAVTVDVP